MSYETSTNLSAGVTTDMSMLVSPEGSSTLLLSTASETSEREGTSLNGQLTFLDNGGKSFYTAMKFFAVIKI